jgi:endonuclease YncB( thermonuclease family)
MEGAAVDNRSKWLYLAGGAVLGGLLVFTFDRFPGGAGNSVNRFALAYEEGRTYRIERVIDGDTAILEGGLRLRYPGVNAPETSRFVECLQPFGREATEANRQLVEGHQVRLRLGSGNLDRYGRLVAGIEVQDPATGRWVDVQEELLRRGLAHRMTGFGPQYNEARLIRAEEAARAARVGLYEIGRESAARVEEPAP